MRLIEVKVIHAAQLIALWANLGFFQEYDNERDLLAAARSGKLDEYVIGMCDWNEGRATPMQEELTSCRQETSTNSSTK